MSLTDRDRKILMFIAPLALLAAYWFLLLAPQRDNAAKAGEALVKQEDARDQAQARASQLESAKTTFATDYAAMVRLGKAVPTTVDMPSLIVQLDSAARGTGIRFQKVAAGQREQAASAKPAPTGGSGGSAGSAAAGGPSAQSASGTSVEQANNTQKSENDKAAKSDGADATTSGSSKPGGAPVGGGAGASGAAAPGGCAPGLECVPLDFEFKGSFFDLADFFHRLKRFVHVANERVAVDGRLLTIDSFKFATKEDSFPKLSAEVTATVYLSPRKQGATAGASPEGPAGPGGATPADNGGPTPAPTPSTTPPTAAATR